MTRARTEAGEDEGAITSRQTLVELARRTMAHARDGTVPQAGAIARVPASHYHDPERWRDEMDAVFRRLPLVLGAGCELAEPGAYKAMEVLGTPVLLVRSPAGPVRAFVNSCSHRGAIVVAEGSGTARRFTCPYHAWSYDTEGCLVGILDRADFGHLDPEANGLVPLPVAERAGLVFGLVDPGRGHTTPDLDPVLDRFLCGYDRLLDHFGFADCTFVGSQRVAGPNWKVAYDGYLDFYHLPVLHRNSFGPDIGNRAIYDAWGPHQRVSNPDPRMLRLEDRPSETWTDAELTTGVWTIFPHASIASFRVTGPDGTGGGPGGGGSGGGGLLHMVSVLYPGAEPGTSTTVQLFLTAFRPTEELSAAIEAQQRFLLDVVRDEDYATGLGIQRALATGAREHVLFGRNEAGGQRFHGWVDRVVAAETDDQLDALFDGAEVVFQR